jgi:hypothetical protein
MVVLAAEAVELLCAPASAEGTGPVLVVELAAGRRSRPRAEDVRVASERIAALPAVVVGVTADPLGLDDVLASFARACDLVVERGDVARVLDTVRAAPQASIVLAQLLRATEGMGVPGGLTAESLAYSALQSGPEFKSWLASKRLPAPRATPGPPVIVERTGDHLVITLNRPEVHNAYSSSMRDALVSALEVAVADPSLSVRLLGAGPSFCSGGDLSEFGTAPDPVTAHLTRVTMSPAAMLARCAERTVAELHGACVGAGIELAAFASEVVAEPSTWFELPEVRMGLIPGAGGTVGIARRIGRHRTAQMALLGSRIDLPTALGWGLVDRVGGR